MARAPKTSGRVTVRIAQLAHGRGLPLPAYQTSGSAGLDLAAAIAPDAPVKLKPGQRKLIPTGLKLELPPDMEAQVRPRSGLALKHGVTVLNSPGTIDSDYRGEVQVILVNLGKKKFVITRGERIAQLVIAPVTQAALTVVEAVGATERGSGGFGSTGTKPPQEIRAARTKKKTVPKAEARVTPAPRKASKTRMNRAKKRKS